MKIRIWLVTRERDTWITGGVILALALVLLAIPGTLLRFVGFVLLGYLGYRALTSLPLGMVPGRPDGASQHRRNLDLRSRVVGFLNTVRSVEDYAQRVKLAGGPEGEVEKSLRSAQMRVMNAAAEVVKAMGRGTPEPTAGPAPETRPRVTHQAPSLTNRQALSRDDFLP